MKTTTVLRSLALLILATLSAPAMATVPNAPNIVGTGSGSFSGSEACTFGSGPDSGTFDITFSNQDGIGNFDVSFVFTDEGPEPPLTGSGSFSTPTQFSFTASITGPPLNESVSATVTITSATTATFTYSGSESDVSPNTFSCTFSGSGGFTFAGSNVIGNSETTPSNTLTTNAQTLATVVATYNSFLNARIQAALQGILTTGVRRSGPGFMIETPNGLSAGDTFKNIGVWASYSHTEYENDFFRTKFDGDTDTIFLGADFAPAENAVLGVAIGYENTRTDTDFNLGRASADGYTIAPYFGMTLDDTWSMDISGGFSSIDTDQYRTAAGTRITSDVDTSRWFISANINGFSEIDNWRLTGRGGFMYAVSTDDSFAESNGTSIAKRKTKIGQLSVSGEAAYALEEFEPFIGATFNQDVTKTKTIFATGTQPSDDENDLLLSLGFRYFGDDGLSVTGQYDTRVGRDDYDEDTLSFNLRWDY